MAPLGDATPHFLGKSSYIGRALRTTTDYSDDHPALQGRIMLTLGERAV